MFFWIFFIILGHICYLSAHIWYARLCNFEEIFLCVLVCVLSKVCVEGKKTVTWQE